MANVLYAYDKKDVEKMIDLVITRIRKGDGTESLLNTENEKFTQIQVAKFLGTNSINHYRPKKRKNIICISFSLANSLLL